MYPVGRIWAPELELIAHTRPGHRLIVLGIRHRITSRETPGQLYVSDPGLMVVPKTHSRTRYGATAVAALKAVVVKPYLTDVIEGIRYEAVECVTKLDLRQPPSPSK